MDTDLGFWLPVGLVTVSAASLTLYSAWKRVGKGRYLCDDCRFNNERDCLKAERPKAVSCTSYRVIQEEK